MYGRAPGHCQRPAIGIEWQLRRSSEGRAHERQRAKHIRPHKGAPGCDRRAEIVANNRCDPPITECGGETQRVAHRVQETKWPEVGVVIRGPPSRAAIAAQVRRDDMIAGSG